VNLRKAERGSADDLLRSWIVPGATVVLGPGAAPDLREYGDIVGRDTAGRAIIQLAVDLRALEKLMAFDAGAADLKWAELVPPRANHPLRRLDQEFNSLRAQRESGLSKIASQKSEGGIALPDHYDDGGLSGGTLGQAGALHFGPGKLSLVVSAPELAIAARAFSFLVSGRILWDKDDGRVRLASSEVPVWPALHVPDLAVGPAALLVLG
jgi:hypothetical protein